MTDFLHKVLFARGNGEDRENDQEEIEEDGVLGWLGGMVKLLLFLNCCCQVEWTARRNRLVSGNSCMFRLD